MQLLNLFMFAVAGTMVTALSPRQHHHTTPSHGSAVKNGTSGASIPAGDFSFDELWRMNNRFWTAFLSPNNQKEAEKINSTLFSEDVKGKIDATRTFDGRELNTEYAFGLFAQIALNPKTFNLLGAPVSYEVTQFAANTNIVATTLIIDFDVLSLGITYPIEVVGWFTYNAKGEISQYDATFLRGLEWQFAQMAADGMRKFNQTEPAKFQRLVQTQLANSVCATHQDHCTGANRQYRSRDECMQFLTNGTVPLGEAWQLGMNNVGCRMVHMNMVPARPAVHCPHLGPSGGGYCTDDRSYAAYTTGRYFTNQAFVPGGRVARVMGSLNGTVHNVTQSPH